MNPTVVIGIGNLLMSDEGVGIHVINQLTRRSEEFPGVDFVDAGTSGMSVVHAIAHRRKAVLIDCALMNEPPGALRRFSPGDVESVKSSGGFSLHEGDLLALLDLSRQLGELPGEIVIFGIQPARIEAGMTLSSELVARMPEYVAAIEAEVGRD